MDSESKSWLDIQAVLTARQDPALAQLLDSASVTYNGSFQLSAPPMVYASLCRYYPLIETVVQDLTGKSFRLVMDTTVPMVTVSGSSPDVDSSTPSEDGVLSFQMGAADVTQAILAPESIAAIPSYLLRFVPYVGSSAVLIATALRQAFYRRSREHGADQLYPRQGDEVSIDVDGLLNMLGHVISRATFFRIFKSGAMDWFVRRAEPAHRLVNGKVVRQPNTYTYLGLQLTPGDAQDLYHWLVRTGAREDPAAALQRALDLPRDQILAFPYRVPDPEKDKLFGAAVSVHEILQAAAGATRLTPLLAGLCDQLALHLIRPESFLAVPWYWFHRVLPDLGPDLGMLYLMSKNCCYIDWARGKDRNTFWVPGGLATLQKWIRSETLPQRIPHKNPSSRGRPRKEVVKSDSRYTREWREANRQLASQYLCRLNTRPGDQGIDWQLRVEEVRLTASDEILKGALYAYLYDEKSSAHTKALSAFASDPRFAPLLRKALHLNPARICHYETLVSEGICQFETLDAEQICHFDTLADSLNCHFETLVSAGICQFDTVIKILHRLKDSSIFPKNTFQPDSGPDFSPTAQDDEKRVVGFFSGEQWDMARILTAVNPVLKERILSSSSGDIFMAWLLQGCLTAAIHSPMSFAVSRTLEASTAPAGPAARLAALPARELAELVRQEVQRMQAGYIGRSYLDTPGADDLEALLVSARDAHTRMQLLQRALDALGIARE